MTTFVLLLGTNGLFLTKSPHFIVVSLKVVDESSWILDFLRAEYDSDYYLFS